MKGKVKYFSNEKGYGFISVEGHGDVFVHYTAIAGDGYKTLKKDDQVSFDTKQGEKGLMAINVQKI